MLDIEEFLQTKKKNGQENFNNFDHEDLIKNYHLYFQIINNLLLWINKNKHLTTLDQNNKLYELFKDEFTKELRKQSLLNKSNNKNKQKKSNLSCRKSTILYFIKNILSLSDINNNLIEYIQLLKLLLRKKPFRNVSGITSITVLTSPFPDGQKFSCQWNCYYCPNEPAHEGNKWQAQPRSYLYLEPAVQRANEQKFGAIGQMFSRMDSYYSMGHIVDKLELIIEGGTHNSYPKEYLG
jgi:histone acetyltransferase (RNA polymerase elongator complex component)